MSARELRVSCQDVEREALGVVRGVSVMGGLGVRLRSGGGPAPPPPLPLLPRWRR